MEPWKRVTYIIVLFSLSLSSIINNVLKVLVVKRCFTVADSKKEPIDWSKVPDIPAHVPYLLIGGGVASLEAYKAIKTRDVDAKVGTM